MQKDFLLGKTLEELSSVVKILGMPAFTAKQLTSWLYQKEIGTIGEMSNLSQKHRLLLEESFEFGCLPPESVANSADGTKKYLFPTRHQRHIESAYIPDRERATLCVSTQVGCKMNCAFCATGKQGFQEQLSAGEIINQVRSLPERKQLTNLVFMGMGEPFDNTDEVLKSLQILTSDWGFAMSPRRITVSTVGLIPGLKRFLAESECHLAISLHSPFDEERKKLMPVQAAYPIAEVIEVLKKQDWFHQRRLSFEYIMFKGINDSSSHLSALARLLSPLASRVNLIRYHATPGSEYRTADESTMLRFRDVLTQKGITTTIRQSRGEDIQAACGLLSTEKNQPIIEH